MTPEYPWLEITLAEEDALDFLVEINFHTGNPAQKTDWPKLTRKKQVCRALCIALLLAKYHGRPDANKEIKLTSNFKANNLISTLGESPDFKQGIFEDHFGRLKFLSVSRGSAHMNKHGKPDFTLPSATYDAGKLPLAHLVFLKKPRAGAAEVEATPIRGEELAAFASRLEKADVGGWQPIVDEIVQDIRERQKSAPPLNEAKNSPPPSDAGVSLTANWKEFVGFQGAVGERIKARFTYPNEGEQWHVICVTPAWLMPWKDIFCAAVLKHQVDLKFAYQSPAAGADCKSVRAQWEMIYGFNYEKKDVLKEVSALIERYRLEMKGWVQLKEKAGRAGKSCGSLEFYESGIAHYFMAILAVRPDKHHEGDNAPTGTSCLIQPYPMYPLDEHENSRCCLYLETPSPLLDVYYRSILKFFQQGVADGYVKAIDLRLVKQKTG